MTGSLEDPLGAVRALKPQLARSPACLPARSFLFLSVWTTAHPDPGRRRVDGLHVGRGRWPRNTGWSSCLGPRRVRSCGGSFLREGQEGKVWRPQGRWLGQAETVESADAGLAQALAEGKPDAPSPLSVPLVPRLSAPRSPVRPLAPRSVRLSPPSVLPVPVRPPSPPSILPALCPSSQPLPVRPPCPLSVLLVLRPSS